MSLSELSSMTKEAEMSAHPKYPDMRTRLQSWIPKLILSPSIALTFAFVYGFIVDKGNIFYIIFVIHFKHGV